MGLGFRKSINLGGGVKVNVGKRGVGVSAGTKGARVSVGSRGARGRVSVPGTGIYYDQKLGASKKSSRRSSSGGSYQSYKTVEQQRQKELEQAKELEKVKKQLEVFEEKIEYFTSIHKDCTETFDWVTIVKTPPFEYGKSGPNEEEAIKYLESYKPTFRDKFFKRIEARRKLLEHEVILAKEEDDKMYTNWQDLKTLGEDVLSGKPESFQKVIDDLAPFDDIKDLGSEFDFKFIGDQAVFNLYVHSEDVIPAEELSLTKTGKLSRKKMTKTKFYELYQDYVSSCVLRIARELFALLPLKNVYINAIGEQFDSSVGSEVEGVVLSVLIDRETLNTLDFDRIDCSDSLENFQHNMKFRKTKGFAFVDKMEVG
ncbi:DUF4236 domain-containing protein [Bacillus marinisedimentorum]|uniref:DUF4236 domain-containing protein n=1 Tax=Bacillus marinisedimentorum TaxID=1821260 RepID=UPI0008731F63|nr:DUF4236 domain-containing protein [Bacillus marinisedimentorum]